MQSEMMIIDTKESKAQVARDDNLAPDSAGQQTSSASESLFLFAVDGGTSDEQLSKLKRSI